MPRRRVSGEAVKPWLGLLASLTLACETRIEPPALSQALAGLSTRDQVTAELSTTDGIVHCALDPTLTPHAVALFVGLARESCAIPAAHFSAPL